MNSSKFPRTQNREQTVREKIRDKEKKLRTSDIQLKQSLRKKQRKQGRYKRYNRIKIIPEIWNASSDWNGPPSDKQNEQKVNLI